MTPTKEKLAELETLATQIAGEEMAEEREERGLLKSLSIALLDLLKGKKAEGDDDKEEKTSEDVDAEGDDDKEPGEGGGYEDMRMAADAEPAEPIVEDVDATEVVLFLQKAMTGLVEDVKALTVKLADLEKAVQSEGELTRQGVGAVLVPLAKGFSDMDKRLLETPAGSPMDGLDDKKRAIERHLSEQAQPATIHEIDKTKLMKALSARIIDNVALRYFKQHGCFPGSAEDSQAKIDQIKALD